MAKISPKYSTIQLGRLSVLRRKHKKIYANNLTLKINAKM